MNWWHDSCFQFFSATRRHTYTQHNDIKHICHRERNSEWLCNHLWQEVWGEQAGGQGSCHFPCFEKSAKHDHWGQTRGEQVPPQAAGAACTQDVGMALPAREDTEQKKTGRAAHGMPTWWAVGFVGRLRGQCGEEGSCGTAKSGGSQILTKILWRGWKSVLNADGLSWHHCTGAFDGLAWVHVPDCCLLRVSWVERSVDQLWTPLRQSPRMLRYAVLCTSLTVKKNVGQRRGSPEL